jgi:predicted nucleic acid-binding protein
MRFTFDTNMLVYAVDKDAGERHRIALDLVRQARGRDCVITLQALAEFFNTLVNKRKIPPTRVMEVIQAWRDAATIVAADESCLVDAMTAVADHGFPFWDAMIWATAKRAGCRVLISEDGQNERTFGGVTIVNPFVSAPSPLLAEALGIAGPGALPSVGANEEIRGGHGSVNPP